MNVIKVDSITHMKLKLLSTMTGFPMGELSESAIDFYIKEYHPVKYKEIEKIIKSV